MFDSDEAEPVGLVETERPLEAPEEVPVGEAEPEEEEPVPVGAAEAVPSAA